MKPLFEDASPDVGLPVSHGLSTRSRLQHRETCRPRGFGMLPLRCELKPKLLVSPLATPLILPHRTPYIRVSTLAHVGIFQD